MSFASCDHCGLEAPEDTLRQCAFCVKSSYCSKNCQLLAWDSHRPACDAALAARAADDATYGASDHTGFYAFLRRMRKRAVELSPWIAGYAVLLAIGGYTVLRKQKQTYDNRRRWANNWTDVL